MTTQNVVEFLIRARDEASDVVQGIGGKLKGIADDLPGAFAVATVAADKFLTAAQDGVDILSGDYSKLGDVIGGLGGPVGQAAGRIVSFLGETTEAVISQVEAFDKLSKKTGASIEFLSEFTQAADDQRVSAEAVAGAFETLSQKLGGVENALEGGGKGIAGALDEMGIAARNAEGSLRSMEELIPEIADAFADMPDGAEKTAAAMAIFGRRGAELIPILNQGRDAMRESMDAAREMGLTFSGELRDAVIELKEAQDELGDEWGALTTRIGVKIVPALRDMTQAINLAAKAQDELSKSGKMWGTHTAAEVIAATQRVTEAEKEAASVARFRASEQRSASAIRREQLAAETRAQDELRRSMIQAGDATDAFYSALAKAGDASALARAAEANAAALAAQTGAARDAAVVAEAYAAAQTRAKDATNELLASTTGSSATLSKQERLYRTMALAAGTLTTEQFGVELARRAINKAFQDGRIDESEAAVRLYNLTTGATSYKDALIQAEGKNGSFQRTLSDVKREAEQAAGAIGRTGSAINNLPGYKRVEIDVWTTYHEINKGARPVGGYDPEELIKTTRANGAFKGAP